MEKYLKKNTVFLKSIFFFLTMAMVLQLFRLQVLEHDTWLVKSDIQNELRKTYQASRGGVYFADGSPLAISELAYGIFALPDNFESDKIKSLGITRDQFASEISSITGVEKDVILTRISNPKIKYVSIASKVSEEILVKINEKFDRTLSLWTYEEQAKRVYPDKTLAAKLIGFVGKDDEGNDVGRYGVEGYFDGVLRGTEGLFEGVRDSANRIIVNEEFDNIKSKNGVDLTLTIDRGIQIMLEERLWYYLNRFKAKEATGVIMEPYTGRILASANLPTFDPNVYWEGEHIICDPVYDYYVLHKQCNPDPEPTATPTPTPGEDGESGELAYYPEGYQEVLLRKIEEEKQKLEEEAERIRQEQQKTPEELESERIERIKKDPRIAKYPEYAREIFREESLPAAEVFRNAANSYLYEPGSIEKVITLAIAYDAQTIPTNPSYQLGGHNGCEKVIDVTLCTAGKTARANVTVEDMLEKSDNVGALRVARTVDIPTYVDTLSRFGTGKTSGVELADEAVFSLKPKNEWTRVDQATVSYGQGGMAVTPIQMCHAWNILASGGESYKPTIVKQINDNGQVKEFVPQFQEQVVSAQAARDALEVNATATSKSIRSAQELYAKYPFSGKTGTANIPDPKSAGYLPNVVNTSYVGVAPVDNPRFTMLIWFREPRSGTDSVAPNGSNTAQFAWIDIAEQLMIKLNVAPQN